MTDRDGDSLPKPETDWTTDEVQSSNYNSKALNAIFTSVDVNMFSLITNCTSAKSAWDILQRHCEGSESVRRTRLRMLTSKFEMMRMEESENILDYDRRLREMANETFSLGDPISNERLVSKVLRSLPERFNIKICAIDEAKDTSQMPLEDLISSLRTFEMNLDMQKKEQGEDNCYKPRMTHTMNSFKFPKKSIILIFAKTLSPLSQRNSQQFQPWNDGKGQSNARKYDSVQCRECQGFGHYANECANILRKNKGYNVSLSDEESDEEEKSNDEDNHTSLNALGDDELEDDEEITLESVQKLYEELFEDWTKRNKLNSTLTKENVDLKAVVAKLEVILSKKDLELGKTKEELHKATETLSKFNSSTSKLESILLMGRDDKKGLGFKDSVFEIGESSKSTVFVKGKADTSPQPQSKSPIKSSQSKRQPAAPIPKKKHSFKTLKNLSKYDVVRGMPNLSSSTPYVCGDCQNGKQTRVSHHMLPYFGTTTLPRIATYGSYGSCGSGKVLEVRRIMTDHGKEFENSSFSSFCDNKGISHEFSAPKKPQQNGIAERKNRTLQEMARVMLTSKCISKRFWAEALNTACHISNRAYLRSGSTMTSHEIIMGKKSNLKYFHVFGCVCYVLNDMDQLAKFDSKSDKYLKKDDVDDLLENPIILENAGVAPDVATPSTTRDTEVTEAEDETNNDDDAVNDGQNIPSKIQKNHPSSQIIGSMHEGVQTRKKEKVDYRKMAGLICMSSLYSQIE
ncbi:uncharacterized protein LOC142523718 [Primulina tabacum]|uniref:uncharacterized protein LOC142523718 n=1 Tax=Primulina tabacum TaxID=48773 RepID=UPI003F5ACF1B